MRLMETLPGASIATGGIKFIRQQIRRTNLLILIDNLEIDE